MNWKSSVYGNCFRAFMFAHLLLLISCAEPPRSSIRCQEYTFAEFHVGIPIPDFMNFEILKPQKTIVFSDTSAVENPIGYLNVVLDTTEWKILASKAIDELAYDPKFEIINDERNENVFYIEYEEKYQGIPLKNMRWYSIFDDILVIREIGLIRDKESRAFKEIYCPLFEGFEISKIREIDGF